MQQLTFIAPTGDAAAGDELNALREIALLAWKYETTSQDKVRQQLKHKLIAYRARWPQKRIRNAAKPN